MPQWVFMPEWTNRVYFGDNLDILRREIPNDYVDLIYLDPPFNSNANYNVLFREKSGEESAAQITVFEDTWHWNQESAAVYHNLVTSGPRKLADLLQSFVGFLGHNDMMAYLVMMAARLQELHRVLKPTGSLYLHCDPTASHYLKLALDAIFSVDEYRNEITWKRTTTHSDSKTWSKVADTIFFYSKTSQFNWNTPRDPHSEEYIASKYRHDDGDGRMYRLDNMTSPNPRRNMMYDWKGFPFPAKGWRYSIATMTRLDEEGRVWYPTKPDGSFDTAKRPQLKRYLEEMEGGVRGTVWTDIRPINSQAQERLGYPTQKPEALLERIISASSNEGDVVMDPFCGCGTTIAVAERFKRRWIGIDITYLAVNLVQRRLKDHFGAELNSYQIVGAPTDFAGAIALKNVDPHQFEWWAVDLVDARPAHGRKKGADSGVDGYINFFDDKSGQAKKLIVQVKSGHTGVHHVRDLNGTMEREKASIGALITLEEPTAPMLREAAAAGVYQPPELPGQFARVQIRTIRELLDGRLLEYPKYRVETFQKAARKSKSRQPELF